MIEVKNLSKNYGARTAIENLTFSVAKGDVVGFLGPNGAGKSTTMKIITGFMAPSSGEALVGGIDVFENPIAVKKKIGYLPETPPVYNDMLVKDYLKYVAKLKGVDNSDLDKRVRYALDKTNLSETATRLIGNLSKGFKQRVGIAQAIVSDPEVLILDEPTVGLDPVQVAEIRDLIKELRGKHTIILSTHILPEVQATCDRVVIINRGRIVAQDTIENLSTYGQAKGMVKLRLRKDSADLGNLLKGVTGFLSADKLSSSREWRVALDGGEETLERIAKRLVEADLGLLEFTPAKVNLEDVFLKLTYGESYGHAGTNSKTGSQGVKLTDANR